MAILVECVRDSEMATARWWHEKWSDVPMEAHSRSNVSYHSSRSEVLPRMSHSSHFWPGMDNGSLHSTSDDGHSGELKLQRAAAHGHPTHRLFTAHLTYPPAARAAVAPVGRSRAKLLFLHILCKSLARSACCCCWLVAWDGGASLGLQIKI